MNSNLMRCVLFFINNILLGFRVSKKNVSLEFRSEIFSFETFNKINNE